MQQRIGYNIAAEHAGSNRQYAVDAQIALHSTYTLILDDYKDGKWFFTKQIQARSPETEVIHRRYWAVDPNNPNAGGWDGSLHRAPGITADNILNTLQGEQKRGGVKVIEQIYCEPGVHVTPEDPQGLELKRMLKLIVDCMKGASARGMRVAVDIGQPVTWRQEEINAGFYDELAFTFAAYPEHFLSIHEYALGDAWFNCNNGNMLLLAKSQPMDVSFLQRLSDSALKAAYVAYPSEAHLGRCEIFARRCRQIGAPVPKMVYTEIGVDHVRLAQLADVERINGQKPMGYPTMWQYWHVRYPQWSAAQTFTEQLKWLNRAMPDYVVGACLFGFDTAFEKGLYHLEDSGEHGLQALLTSYADSIRAGTQQPPPPPPPMTLEQRVAVLETDVADLKAWRSTHEGGK